jgi:hypothetical protein
MRLSKTLTAAVNRGVLLGDPVRGYLGYAYGRSGRRGEAERLAAAAAARLFNQALIYAGLGDKDRVLKRWTVWLAWSFSDRKKASRSLRLSRGDPRVKVLRKKSWSAGVALLHSDCHVIAARPM